MSLSRRELILQYMAATLGGLTSVGDRIYRSRVEAFSRDEAPALVIEAGINAMLGSVLAAAPAIYGGLTVGLSEVSKGSPQLFLNAWSNAKTVVTIDPAVVVSLQAMAAAHDLPVAFRDGLT